MARFSRDFKSLLTTSEIGNGNRDALQQTAKKIAGKTPASWP
jgi:hypothetical protein